MLFYSFNCLFYKFELLIGMSSVGISAYRKVLWKGNDPYDFYSTYIRELNNMQRLKDDPDYFEVNTALKAWSSTRFTLLHPGMLKVRTMTSRTILGVDIDVLLAVSKEAELSCLRMLLGLIFENNIMLFFDIYNLIVVCYNTILYLLS